MKCSSFEFFTHGGRKQIFLLQRSTLNLFAPIFQLQLVKFLSVASQSFALWIISCTSYQPLGPNQCACFSDELPVSLFTLRLGIRGKINHFAFIHLIYDDKTGSLVLKRLYSINSSSKWRQFATNFTICIAFSFFESVRTKIYSQSPPLQFHFYSSFFQSTFMRLSNAKAKKRRMPTFRVYECGAVSFSSSSSSF